MGTYSTRGAARLVAVLTGLALLATVPIALAADASGQRSQAAQTQAAQLRAGAGSLDARANAATLELYALESRPSPRTRRPRGPRRPPDAGRAGAGSSRQAARHRQAGRSRLRVAARGAGAGSLQTAGPGRSAGGPAELQLTRRGPHGARQPQPSRGPEQPDHRAGARSPDAARRPRRAARGTSGGARRSRRCRRPALATARRDRSCTPQLRGGPPAAAGPERARIAAIEAQARTAEQQAAALLDRRPGFCSDSRPPRTERRRSPSPRPAIPSTGGRRPACRPLRASSRSIQR